MSVNKTTLKSVQLNAIDTDHLGNCRFAVKDFYTALINHSDSALITGLTKPDLAVARWVINPQDLNDAEPLIKQLNKRKSEQAFIIVELLSGTESLPFDHQSRQAILKIIASIDLFICSAQILQLITQTPISTASWKVDDETLNCIAQYCDFLLVDNKQNHWLYLSSTGQGHFSFSQETPLVSCCAGVISALIAVFMLCGKRSNDALVLALAYLQQILQHNLKYTNVSPLDYSLNFQKKAPQAFCWPQELAHYPLLKTALNEQVLPRFTKTDTLALGLYPVIDSLDWLEKLLEQGIKTIQLRIKALAMPLLDEIIAKAALLGRRYNARLFINDHWQLAIKHQCYGVHLGQEDIGLSNLKAIQQAGLRLGISTHSEYEWLRIISIKPSYIAMGTVYPTQTKPAILIGLSNLNNWCKTLADHYPLVAIGGINLENIDDVLNTGVRSIALVTAITLATDYKQATRLLAAKLES